MKSLVSVIIPAYNAEGFIKESIESCINQTYENVEIIVVNDGSADNTGHEIRECVCKYSNIKFIDSVHIGKVNAVNLGVRHSGGEYIAIHAADDVCLDFRLKKEVEAMDRDEKNVLVYGDCIYADENLNPIKTYGRSKTDENILNYSERLLYGNIITGGTVLIKRSIADRIFPIPSNLLFEDWWIAFISSFYGNIVHLPMPLIKYRQHSGNDNASFNILNPLLRVKKIKKNYSRHFNYYLEFEKFIEQSEPDYKKSFMPIIRFNVIMRKFVLTGNLFRRAALAKDFLPGGNIGLKNKIKLYLYMLTGDKIIYADQILRCFIKKVIFFIYR